MPHDSNNILNVTLRGAVRPLGYAFLFSFVINVLYLALPIYMVQLSGRVFSSQSIATLLVCRLALLPFFSFPLR